MTLIFVGFSQKITWIFPSAHMRKTKAHPDQSRSLWSHHPLWVWPGWGFTIPWAATTWNMGGFHTWMVYFMENPNLKLVGGWSMSIITIDGWGFNQSYGDMDRWISLVGGWATPLKNDWVRQLGWWHSQYMEKSKPCSKPPTRKWMTSGYPHDLGNLHLVPCFFALCATHASLIKRLRLRACSSKVSAFRRKT